MPVSPPFVSLFKTNKYQPATGGKDDCHDNLVSTITLTQCDPPGKNLAMPLLYKRKIASESDNTEDPVGKKMLARTSKQTK